MGDGNNKHHVLVALPFPEPVDMFNALRKKFPNYQFSYRKTTHVQDFNMEAKNMPDDVWKEVTILFTLTALPPHLDMIPKLKMVQVYSAGVDHVRNHPIYTDSKIPICTVSGIHGTTIAEWVVMTTLVVSRHYNLMHEWQQAQSWGPPNQPGRLSKLGMERTRDMLGQRIGVLGYGSIGRQVGRVAKAMGMEVYAYTANPRDSPESKWDHGYILPGTGDPDGTVPKQWFSGTTKEDLYHFLAADLDVLVVSVPLTSHTEHLLAKNEFEILNKRNAFVVNISRGQILDQRALIAELEAFVDDESPRNKGKHLLPGVGRAGLRGAALDVADPEPLPQGHPLFTAPNCIVTPHISGASVQYSERAFDVLSLNIGRLENGERLINAVNRKSGY